MKKLLVLAAAAVAIMPAAAFAQANWPSEPIHAVVPFPAGGQADIVTRIIATPLSEIFGQPVLVEAQPGAGGNVGTQAVVESPADGYTWLHSGVPLTTAPGMSPNTLPFDPLEDLEPVIRIGTTSFVLAVPSELPVESVEELVAYIKDRPGQLAYAASGVGSLVHLAGELFKLQAGLDIAMVPYNGQPPAIADLLANRVQFMMLGISLAQPLVESGELKALAVLDSEPHWLLPDTPTIVEAGYADLTLSGWAGINVPAGTPQEIIEEINAAVAEVIVRHDIEERFRNIGWKTVEPHTPAEFRSFLESEVVRWAEVIEAAGVETN